MLALVGPLLLALVGLLLLAWLGLEALSVWLLMIVALMASSVGVPLASGLWQAAEQWVEEVGEVTLMTKMRCHQNHTV
jgi:hypothetical protein